MRKRKEGGGGEGESKKEGRGERGEGRRRDLPFSDVVGSRGSEVESSTEACTLQGRGHIGHGHEAWSLALRLLELCEEGVEELVERSVLRETYNQDEQRSRNSERKRGQKGSSRRGR